MLCPVGHPFAGRTVPLAALRDENLILREKGSASRDFLDGLLQMEELRLTPAWQCVSTRAIVKAVQAGFGISILPRLMIRSELARGDVALFSLEGVSLRRRYRILYHQNKFLTPAMEELIRLCEGALPEGAAL